MTIIASGEVLVDTSAWIAYFRRQEPLHSMVAALLEENRICCLGLILAELLQGAKGESEQAILRDFQAVFPFISETTRLWVAAGELSGGLRRKGQTIGLADCFIAVAAKDRGAAILTSDRHFDWLREAIGVELVLPTQERTP